LFRLAELKKLTGGTGVGDLSGGLAVWGRQWDILFTLSLMKQHLNKAEIADIGLTHRGTSTGKTSALPRAGGSAAELTHRYPRGGQSDRL